jgi:hypothetical protein
MTIPTTTVHIIPPLRVIHLDGAVHSCFFSVYIFPLPRSWWRRFFTMGSSMWQFTNWFIVFGDGRLVHTVPVAKRVSEQRYRVSET